MPDDEHPIDMYISQLGWHLHLPIAERDQVLAEVRGHLEERARALHETGVSDQSRPSGKPYWPLDRSVGSAGSCGPPTPLAGRNAPLAHRHAHGCRSGLGPLAGRHRTRNDLQLRP